MSTADDQHPFTLRHAGPRKELPALSGGGSMLPAVRPSADGNGIPARPPSKAWRVPSLAEIAAAEAKEKTEIRQP